MSEDIYSFLRGKVSPIIKLYRERFIAFEAQKEQIALSPLRSKNVYLLLHPLVLFNYLLVRALRIWVIFRIRNLKNNAGF
jgi:hypothetical protein